MDKELICKECEEPIDEDDEPIELEDGSLICSECFDMYYFTCEMCETVHHVDDMKYWGDCRVCPDCLDEQCPSCDVDDNEEETQDAYDALKNEYLGKKAKEVYRGKTVDFDWNTDMDGEYEISYHFQVTIDDNCRISDISRIKAETLLWESTTSSGYSAYPVNDYDYSDIAADKIKWEILSYEEDE